MVHEQVERSGQEEGFCHNCDGVSSRATLRRKTDEFHKGRRLRRDGLRPCVYCRHDPLKCRHRRGKFKFRAGSSKRFDAKFQRDQVWLDHADTEIEFLDVTPELQKSYAGGSLSTFTDSLDIAFQDNFSATASSPVWPTTPLSGRPQASPNTNELPLTYTATSERFSSPLTAENGSGDSHSNPFSFSQSGNVRHSDSHWSVDTMSSTADPPSNPTENSHHRPHATNISFPPNLSAVRTPQNGLSPHSNDTLSPALYKDQSFWPTSHTSIECICLMRHFIQTIGPWFDIYDRSHHFSVVVPQRAKTCPSLLNAIFAVSAKSLVEISSYRAGDGTVVFDGIRLPGLTATTAIAYHNKCIAYFLEVSDQLELMQDEDLLAAAIILRYYEFLDTPRGGESQERFLKTFQVLVTSQASTAFSSPNSADTAPSSESPLSLSTAGREPMKTSFRPVMCWMALRLEVTSAFIKQRSIGIPLDPWATQRSFDPSDDNAWAHRLILHCADVLQFCYADEVTFDRSRVDRWRELKNFEDLCDTQKPESFCSILYQEPNRSQGHPFPQVWYMSDFHVLGMQYLELARILQTVYDPTLPRLGIGSIVATRRVSMIVREIAVRVCGNAISNPRIQSALITAQLAISLTGQYFTDSFEQSSILNMLDKLQSDYAWPTTKTIAELKQIWSWEDMSEADEES